MPELDAEKPDDGMPDEINDDEEDKCPAIADIFRSKTESLPNE